MKTPFDVIALGAISALAVYVAYLIFKGNKIDYTGHGTFVPGGGQSGGHGATGSW